jgi:transcriptional regulator with XRE-family HTH domain
MNEFMNINTQLLKKLREDRAWSQEHLAKAAGISLRTVQRIESEGKASAESRMAIASALNVNASELVFSESIDPDKNILSRNATYWYTGAITSAIFACLALYNSSVPHAYVGLSYAITGVLVSSIWAIIGVRFWQKERL